MALSAGRAWARHDCKARLRGKRVKTTVSDSSAPGPLDKAGRLPEPIGNTPTAEAEARYCAQARGPRHGRVPQTNKPPANPERFKTASGGDEAIQRNAERPVSGQFRLFPAQPLSPPNRVNVVIAARASRS